MKRILAIAGAGALIAWTGLGLVAWSSVARRVTVVLSDAESDTEEARPLLALADEIGALHADIRALAGAMGANAEALHAGLTANQDEHAAALERQLAALRDEVGSYTPPSSDELADLQRELRELQGARVAPAAASEPARLVTTAPAAAEPSAEPALAPAAPEPPAAKPRGSFLAFRLPSDDFRFDERRTWTVQPALSRVGFDAKSTLHDFSGTTSSLEGELAVDLARPAESPRVRLRVESGALATSDAKRDEAMREHLAVAEHPALEFELTRFESDSIDAGVRKVAGRAHGRMRIRGVEREVSMPVQLSIDDALRLCVEGEMPLDLTDFAVPVPSKLGLISMEKDVKVWISLRLRVNPRTEE